MKLKIVNRKRFILSMTLVIGAVLCIISHSVTLSKTPEKYSTILVSSGDTLWSIAEEEKNSNPYYENKDIRYIVNDIKLINNLENSNLTNNQQLNIPTI